MNKKQIIMHQINSGVTCDKDCIVHQFITHNGCKTCKAIMDSPYRKDFIQGKTDEQIAEEILNCIKEC